MSEKRDMLEAPCLYCGYNGKGYWQKGTHDKICPWHNVGGITEREELLRQSVKSYALQVVREAVEAEKSKAKYYWPHEAKIISEHVADHIMSEIKSKLEES